MRYITCFKTQNNNKENAGFIQPMILCNLGSPKNWTSDTHKKNQQCESGMQNQGSNEAIHGTENLVNVAQ